MAEGVDTRAPVDSSRRDYLREHLREVPAFRALVRSVECRLFERAAPFEWPVLDVGCGDGHFAAAAFDRPLSAGIELDARLLAEARRRGGHLCVLRASATALPFADSVFKTVVANCVVEHIPDLDAALSEVRRVLAPAGRFLFGVPSQHFGPMLLGSTLLKGAGLGGAARAYGDWFNRHSLHFHTYDPTDWHARLAARGFRVRSWEYYVSPAAHRAFDLAHYLSVPNLVARRLTGRWVVPPLTLAARLYERWLRPFCDEPPPAEGAYIFFDTTAV